jgi:clan AA aspartic protease
MGKVMTRIKLANELDAGNALNGILDSAAVRTAEVDALVDTGATMLVLPEDIVKALGVRIEPPRSVRLAGGTVRSFAVARGLRIEILNRWMTCDALIMPAGTTPLVGQVQLETLDLWVDAKSQDLVPNPASPDEPIVDLLQAS